MTPIQCKGPAGSPRRGPGTPARQDMQGLALTGAGRRTARPCGPGPSTGAPRRGPAAAHRVDGWGPCCSLQATSASASRLLTVSANLASVAAAHGSFRYFFQRGCMPYTCARAGPPLPSTQPSVVSAAEARAARHRAARRGRRRAPPPLRPRAHAPRRAQGPRAARRRAGRRLGGRAAHPHARVRQVHGRRHVGAQALQVLLLGRVQVPRVQHLCAAAAQCRPASAAGACASRACCAAPRGCLAPAAAAALARADGRARADGPARARACRPPARPPRPGQPPATRRRLLLTRHRTAQRARSQPPAVRPARAAASDALLVARGAPGTRLLQRQRGREAGAEHAAALLAVPRARAHVGAEVRHRALDAAHEAHAARQQRRPALLFGVCARVALRVRAAAPWPGTPVELAA